TDTDTNSGGDITAVTTAVGSGLQGGGTTGALAVSMLTTCASGQLLKWSGTAWACGNDIDTDTDTNAGGDITGVTAGAGLTGAGSPGAVTVALDLTCAVARYLNAAGDTLGGALGAGGYRITNRGCPTGYVKAGPALCVESG